MFSFVMLFNQPRTVAGDSGMQTLTHELIDAALAAGGRYYLPYRLHATPDQFRRVMRLPQAESILRGSSCQIRPGRAVPEPVLFKYKDPP